MNAIIRADIVIFEAWLTAANELYDEINYAQKLKEETKSYG